MADILHPLTPDMWLVKQLRANTALMALVGNRVFDEDGVDLAPYANVQGGGWPYIVYRVEDAGVDMVHENRPFLASGLAVVRGVMRRDKVPPGVTLKSYLAPATAAGGIAGMIQATLTGVRDPSAAVGRVWSSQYKGPHKHGYLSENVDHLELGGKFLIQNTAT